MKSTSLNHSPLFDFSPEMITIRNEIENGRKVITMQLAILLAGIGGTILFLLADSGSWASFEAYKRAAMAMHGIGCGNVCTNSISSGSLPIVFLWLVFGSAVASWHQDVS